MKDHPIAAGIWLAVVASGIGFGARAGLSSSAEQEHQAKKTEMNKQLDEIINVGRQGDYAVAVQQLEAMISKHPNHPGLYLNLGIAQRAAERLDDAERSFAKVLELDPNDFDALAEQANIQRERGNTEAALDLMEKIPAGKGRVAIRLRDDPLWFEIADNPRVQALHEKHGAVEDTSLHIERMKEKGAAQGVHTP